MTVEKDKISWGIISTAQIGREVFVPALRDTEHGEIVAVAGRDTARTSAFAADLNIKETYNNYDHLLDNDSIDAVYLPLPNSMHEKWAVRAAERGKHIFCEKPLATTPAAAHRMLDAAKRNNVLLWEAMVFKYHPQTLRLQSIIKDGIIGNPRHLQMRMSINLARDDNIRWNYELGGGVLLDIGCYLITFARWAAGSEPTHVAATWEIDKKYHVDRHMALLLTFEGGFTANLFGGFDGAASSGAHLIGSQGSIHINQPTHPYEDSFYTLSTPRATEQVKLHNGVRAFTPALNYFHGCLLNQTPAPVSNDDPIKNLRVMEAAKRSAETSKTIPLDMN